MSLKLWIPPDGELHTINAIHKYKKMLGCGVSSIKPATVDHVQVISTGGGAHTFVSDWCQITITCWAGKDQWSRARELAGFVSGILEVEAKTGFLDGVPCYGISTVNKPYNDLDPVTGVARVSQTIRIALRGHYQERS